jgi:hypothetical protein
MQRKNTIDISSAHHHQAYMLITPRKPIVWLCQAQHSVLLNVTASTWHSLQRHLGLGYLGLMPLLCLLKPPHFVLAQLCCLQLLPQPLLLLLAVARTAIAASSPCIRCTECSAAAAAAWPI